MDRNTHETKTSNPLAWNASYSANIASTGDDEVAADVDEPPDLLKKPSMPTFQRTEIKGICRTSSLLTQAIQSENKDLGYYEDDEDDGEDDDDSSNNKASMPRPTLKFVPQPRRRSMASEISIATTAELTSDTGMTSPSRAGTPSPPHYGMGILRIPSQLGFEPEIRPIISPPSHAAAIDFKRAGATPKAEAPKKRCISFACGNPPPTAQPKKTVAPPVARPAPMVKSPSAEGAPRQTRIKFACPARPASTQNTPPRKHAEDSKATIKIESPSTPRRLSHGLRGLPSPKASVPRRMSKSPAPPRRPKLLKANASDLTSDASHFHEFASSESRVDDWIRQEQCAAKKKITIDDTLTKENTIRRLAKEAEEEEAEEGAELDDDEDEEEDEIEDDNDNDDDEANDDDDEDEDEEDLDSVHSDNSHRRARHMYDDYDSDGTDDSADFSEGYRTDEETGFADSDDESGGEEFFWTPGTAVIIPGAMLSNYRRPSINEPLSDASTTAGSFRPVGRRRRSARAPSPDAADLPDSTDFVCGTFDEDRPLEDAYMSALEARQREKMHVIPQDIDPSFPLSDPEDEDNVGKKRSSHDDAEADDTEGRARRHKKDQVSPRRYHSPPPKHMVSPPAKVRGRSPCPRAAGRTSPRRARSPAPFPTVHFASPAPAHQPNCFNMKMAKSLPRPMGMLGHIRNGRRRPTTGVHAAYSDDADVHVRGAIDIVKGLEQKRRRRREKFFKNYCDRARKGQLPERKAIPAGVGAEKMKEIGLLMAGKKDHGDFVLSI